MEGSHFRLSDFTQPHTLTENKFPAVIFNLVCILISSPVENSKNDMYILHCN